MQDLSEVESEAESYTGCLIESLMDMVARAERLHDPKSLERRVDARYVRSVLGVQFAPGVSVNPRLPEQFQSGE